jgi:hypothetical protein
VASLVRRSFFSALVSGRYLLRTLNAWVAAIRRQPMFLHLYHISLTVAVENVLELGNRRGDLQAHVEDLLLALEADVGGPSDHAGDIALGLDVLADTEVARALLKERVLCALEAGERAARTGIRTLACFLEPVALPCGKGAGAAFFPFGGILLSRLSLREKPLANVHPLDSFCISKSERALLPLCALAIVKTAAVHVWSGRRSCCRSGGGEGCAYRLTLGVCRREELSKSSSRRSGALWEIWLACAVHGPH